MASDGLYQEIGPGSLRVLSPAKINLFLHVTGKRSDGYHELCSLMCRIALYDELFIRTGADSVSVHCDHPDAPGNETNLAHRAAKLFFHALNQDQGAAIRLKKNIPVAAGLGGGSSNAASVLTALNRFFGNPLSKERLMAMGASLGADVPFFIFGRPAIARGIGEKLETYDHLSRRHVVVVTPRIRVSTAEVFKKLNLGLTKCKKKFNTLSFKSRMFDAGRHLCNDLETYTASNYPVIEDIKKMLIQQGAEGALMSGSGSSVFGLFRDERNACEAHRCLSAQSEWDVFLTHMIT